MYVMKTSTLTERLHLATTRRIVIIPNQITIEKHHGYIRHINIRFL